MLRVILLAIFVVAGGIALYKLVQALRTRQWDWAGAGFAILFVLVALWLRHETGTGGLLE